jgi:ferric-dicitrate binding protein FerR (iron transport regulator)
MPSSPDSQTNNKSLVTSAPTVRLTAHWTPRKRTIAFAVFAMGVLAACALAAWLAGQIVGKALKMTEASPNPSASLDGGSPVQLATSAR